MATGDPSLLAPVEIAQYSSRRSLGRLIARFALPKEPVHYGPWLGAMRAISADLVPPRFAAGGSNFLYLPRQGRWVRRNGQVQKFDTFGSAVGMLPAKWGAKCRQLEEFKSSAISDGIPTMIGLLTKETMGGGVIDDGLFSNVWVRDQVNNVNYSVGDEFTPGYPVPGSVQSLKFVPLWNDSGDGGINRGVDEFHRRLFFGGSRNMLKIGNWRYFPNLNGTPCRWSETFTPASQALLFSRPTPDPNGITSSNANWGAVGAANRTAAVSEVAYADPTTDTSYDRFDTTVTASSTLTAVFDNVSTIATNLLTTGFTIHMNFRCSAAYASRMVITIDNAAGGKTIYSNIPYKGSGNSDNTDASGYGAQGPITGAFVQYSIIVTAARMASAVPTWAQTDQLRVAISNSGSPASSTWDLGQIEVRVGSQAIQANRLIPSGPLPPTHAGTLAKGNPVAADSNQLFSPISDVTHGAWISTGGNTTLWDRINDISAPSTAQQDATYIITPSGAAGTETAEVKLAPIGFTPDAADLLQVSMRIKQSSVGTSTLTLSLVENTTVRQSIVITPSKNGFAYIPLWTITAATVAAISDWTNLRLRFVSSRSSNFDFVAISVTSLVYTPSTARVQGGGWQGKKRLLFGVAYRFSDDSVWMPTTPRLPNSSLVNGFGMFTVDASNSETVYDSLLWTNIPVPPFDVKSKLLLACPPIDSTTEDNLQLDPTDLRIVDEVDAATTTYTWTKADPDAWDLDVDGTLVRYDHIMPPRSRYLGAGDSRAAVSFSGLNPTAIVLAPVGVNLADNAAGTGGDYDLNVADTSSTAFGAHASYYIVATSGLTLVRDTGAATSTKAFSFSIYDTLEKLVDAINATSCTDTDWTGGAGKASQWRAQIVPGIDPHIPTATALCLTQNVISSIDTATDAFLRKPAGGLSTVSIGEFCIGAGITDGTYVTKIVSDTVLAISQTTTATANVAVQFVSGTGDSITGATHSTYEGYVRVIANSLPGFLFLTGTYLDQFPVEKSAIWNTVANPLSTKCAPNAWSGSEANKRIPPDASAGISMGIKGLRNGFVTPFQYKRAVIRKEGIGPGYDKDLRLQVTNEASGCCAWQSLCSGNDVVFLFSPEGWIACDLEEEISISQDVWVHSKSDATVGVGDYSYEMPLCVAATAADNDSAYLIAQVMRGALWVNYRSSGATPNAQTVFDFSSGKTVAGLRAVLREADDPIAPNHLWGWSTVLNRSFTAMGAGSRSDGSHLYGWNDANAGSTGDGRIDEFETTDQDNGTDIAASVVGAFLKARDGRQLSAQEILWEHDSPTGSTGSVSFTRSYALDAYTMTPSTSSSAVVSRDLKLLVFPARTPTAACYLTFSQATGGARTWRGATLWLKDLPQSYR